MSTSFSLSYSYHQLPEMSSMDSQKGENPFFHLIIQVLGILIGSGIMLIIAVYEEDIKQAFDWNNWMNITIVIGWMIQILLRVINGLRYYLLTEKINGYYMGVCLPTDKASCLSYWLTSKTLKAYSMVYQPKWDLPFRSRDHQCTWFTGCFPQS